MPKQTEENVREVTFPSEQNDAQLLKHEGDIIAGMKESEKPYAENGDEPKPRFQGTLLQALLEASKYQETTTKTIEVVRDGVVFFTFRIRPLTEADYEFCKEKSTKYVRNKQLGFKMPESSNGVKYRSWLIYKATVEEDRKETWDNRALWKAFEEAGKDVLTGTDAVDAILKPGEKAAIVDEIDKLSGFQTDNLEEVVNPEETIKN